MIDFKTGDSYGAWDEAKLSDYEKIKLHKYRQQLIVYKLLIEGSKTFKEKVSSLSLSFVEDMKAELLVLDVHGEETERMKKLLGAVYKKISSCDFVDVSKYEKNCKGIFSFEEDLIAGTI